MAKFYGSLVGAVLQAVTKQFVNNFLKDGTDHIIVRDKVALTTANVIGDQVSLGFFKSGAFLSEGSAFMNDALGAGTKVNIGDVNYPTGLANQIDTSSAGNGNLWRTFTPAQMGLPLWQALGYAADPKTTIELLATIAGANVSTAGSLAWRAVGINR